MATEGNSFENILLAQERFGKYLYETWSKTSENILFSPYSLHAILAFLYKSSKGNTNKEFTKILRLSDAEKAVKGYESLIKYVHSLDDINFHNEIKVYISNSYKLASWIQNARNVYELDIQNIPDDDNSISIINSTLRTTSEKRLDNIDVEYLKKSDDLVLINTVHFKAPWAREFNISNTEGLMTFTVSENASVEVTMMTGLHGYKYKTDEHLEAKIIELPFANEKVSMLIILPDDIYGIDKLEAELTDFDIEELTDYLNPSFIEVSMPKFKVEVTTDLVGQLKAMGLHSVFDHSTCDLSGLVEGSKSPVISRVIHKVSLEVDEKGKPPSPPPTDHRGRGYCQVIEDIVRVDHPFIIYILVQDDTPSVLFQGKIINPIL